MIGRVWHIARREWLEQLRQPVMLGTIAALYILIAGLVLFLLGLIQLAHADPEAVKTIQQLAGGFGFAEDRVLQTFARTAIGAYTFLVFTQYLGFGAVLCGHAVLHDRQSHTLPFLLLAPVGRVDLLVGKLIGALGPITALWMAINLCGAGLITLLPVSTDAAEFLVTNPAWWVAFALGGPLWGGFVGGLCVVVSSLARDVRTAQQGVWFVVFFATLIAGYLLAGRLHEGIGAQLQACALAATGLAGSIGLGVAIMRRDLGR